MERPVGERTEDVMSRMEGRPLAPQQDLKNGAESTSHGGHQAEEQRHAAISGMQPERQRSQKPERQEPENPPHPAEVVVVHVGPHEVRPCPAVGQVRDNDRERRSANQLEWGAHRHNIFGVMRSIWCYSLFAVLLLPSVASAQDIPPYVPANPVLASRSALYAQPFVSPENGFQFRFVADYYNAVEVAQSGNGSFRQYIFDAEVLQGDFWVTRDVSRRVFVIADLPIRGGYDGFLDGFLNWYHNLIGLQVPARDELPKNVFQWSFALPDSTVNRPKPGTFIGDLRTGAGIRFGHLQVVASVTLPTGTVDQDGWTRHVVGTSVALTDELVRSQRFVLDASASAGYTPVHGALSPYQVSTFASGLVSGRWRFAGQQSVFSTLWIQSDNWKNTGFTSLDAPEVSMDFGFLLHLKSHWPELQIGMTQDLVPTGPAMDVGFTLGLRW
jgi:hypothetical protein